MSNDIFHPRCNTPKRVTIWPGPSPRSGNTDSFEERSQQRRTVDNRVSDLSGPRFELQISRSRDEHVTAGPTGR